MSAPPNSSSWGPLQDGSMFEINCSPLIGRPAERCAWLRAHGPSSTRREHARPPLATRLRGTRSPRTRERHVGSRQHIRRSDGHDARGRHPHRERRRRCEALRGRFEKTIEYLAEEHPSNYQPLTAKYVAEHSFTSVDLTPTTLVLRQINVAGKEVDRIKITK